MANHVAPSSESDDFNCPYCGVYAHQRPLQVRYIAKHRNQIVDPTGCENESARVCHHCGQRTLWNGIKMLLPLGSTAELPNDDMPEDVKIDYLEAREISNLSPRGAAALLRLAIQKLCIHLGKPGKNINDDIGALVADGLPVGVQKALDIVRVSGNEAVHPGEINFEDSPEIVQQLFSLTNMIVHKMITEPKELDTIFQALPASKLQAITKRDAPSTSS